MIKIYLFLISKTSDLIEKESNSSMQPMFTPIPLGSDFL